MESVKQYVQQLLRVLLILIIELLLKLGDDTLKFERRHRFLSVKPQLLHELSKSNG